MTISSITIVKHGMPFIGKVLRQVRPYVKEMFITVSEHADEETMHEVWKFVDKYDNVILDTEHTEDMGQLTAERNKQVEAATSDWILHLDDDDYWPTKEFEKCLEELDKDPETLAYSVSPYQLLDLKTYDANWLKRSFSKFLRRDGLRYRHPFPLDLPCDSEGSKLYWKTHPQVQTLSPHFYHLSSIKDRSFREEPGTPERYLNLRNIGDPKKFVEPVTL